MSVKRPDISLSRNGGVIDVTLENFEAGDRWNVYLSPDKFGILEQQVAGHDEATYQISGLNAEQNYTVRVSLNNAPLSASYVVTADFSNQRPPHIEIEPATSVSFAIVQETINTPWGVSATVDVLEVDNIIEEAQPGGPRISIGDNQTL